ncbi:MAG: hypothetical protein ACPGU1_18595 [Myxococcota bacterium]
MAHDGVTVLLVRWALALVILAGLSCDDAFAGQPRLVTLSYVLGEGAGDCPSRAALHEAVAQRLGYMPFTHDAQEHVEVAIEARGSTYRARIRLSRADAPTRAEREVEATVRGCDEIVDALALSVSLALDPDAVERVKRPRRARDLTPERRGRRQPAAALVGVVAPLGSGATSPAASGVWLVGARTGVSWGMTPQVAPEIIFEGAYHRRLWGLGLELRATLPLPRQVEGGAIQGGRALAGVYGCVGWDWFRGCGHASAGVSYLAGDGLQDAQSEGLFVASAGGRLQFLWPLTEALRLNILAGMEVALVQVSARVGADTAWRSGPVGLEASAGLLWRL